MNIQVITKEVDKIFRAVKDGNDLPAAKSNILNLFKKVVVDNAPILITYIGKRAPYTDNLYGTNLTWTKKGETLRVSAEAAKKMLRHIDVFARGDKESRKLTPEEEQSPKTQENKTAEGDVEQEARDIINNMNNVEMIRDYVEKNFSGTKMHHAIKNIETAREFAINLIDRVGIA